MSKKSVGDRENFIKGLINEAVWLFRLFMHSDFGCGESGDRSAFWVMCIKP